MEKKVKKTDALMFLKNKGIDESLNNVRTINHTALLMEEYAEFKIKEYERINIVSLKEHEELLEKHKKLLAVHNKLQIDYLATVKENTRLLKNAIMLMKDLIELKENNLINHGENGRGTI